MLKRKVLAALALTLAAGSATAQTSLESMESVGVMRERCLVARRVDNLGPEVLVDDFTTAGGYFLCLGYMKGYMDSFFRLATLAGVARMEDEDSELALVFLQPGINPFTCVETGITAGQLAHLFLNWTDKHPERWQAKAYLVMAEVIGEAYCGADWPQGRQDGMTE